MTLPAVIPLFPLPDVVLFPRIPLALHVFEPRYRAMVRDAARGARLVGMVLLRGDGQRGREGHPEVFPVGTAGEMVHVEELPDGRFDVVLRGVTTFAITREIDRRTLYREAVVAARPLAQDWVDPGLRARIDILFRRYLARIGRSTGPATVVDSVVDDECLVNFFAQHLGVTPLERQALLETDSLAERARRLCDTLEFALEELRLHGGGPAGRPH
ncbi:MAG: LON peptidase substrate-binding domain-containing protein [Candidatus Binatia bacterium]